MPPVLLRCSTQRPGNPSPLAGKSPQSTIRKRSIPGTSPDITRKSQLHTTLRNLLRQENTAVAELLDEPAVR
jgi:hypothetical protein